jgi:metal-responsive CopG/Arc/MetJ family transcriptional regulator
MIRVAILLDEEQYKKLKKLANAKGVSASEMIRRGVETILGENADDRLLKLERRVVVLEEKSHTHE